MGWLDRWRGRPSPEAPALPADGRRALDAPLVLVHGVLPVGTKVTWEQGAPRRARLGEPLPLAELVLPAGTELELDGAPRQTPSITAARLPSALPIAGLTLPAGSELELDERARVTGVVLGARLVGVPGPAGLTWDRGAFVAFVDGAWELDPFPNEP